jgi:uncharacterized protein with HEPN domain
MTRRSESEWLSDIISWGERLEHHLAGVDRNAFFENRLIQDAVSKCVEAIGEAAGKLDDLDPDLDRSVPDLNLKLARRTRDRLSHGYYRIDLTLLWGDGDRRHPEDSRRGKGNQTALRRRTRNWRGTLTVDPTFIRS